MDAKYLKVVFYLKNISKHRDDRRVIDLSGK